MATKNTYLNLHFYYFHIPCNKFCDIFLTIGSRSSLMCLSMLFELRKHSATYRPFIHPFIPQSPLNSSIRNIDNPNQHYAHHKQQSRLCATCRLLIEGTPIAHSTNTYIWTECCMNNDDHRVAPLRFWERPTRDLCETQTKGPPPTTLP